VPVQAQAGNITLQASTGDITVTGTGSLVTHGVAKQFVDTTQFASGGTITLAADIGTVDIQPGAVIDFAGAASGGNGGSLIVNAGGTNSVQFDGTLLGATAPGFDGSNFNLNTGGAVALDDLAQLLTSAGVRGGISVEAGQGDLSLGKTLKASQVALVADGGSVIVNGTIDASGVAGGTIELFGTGTAVNGVVSGGVTVNGSLLARASDPSQFGGTVEIGTSGRFDPATGSYNTDFGYENVAAASSGSIAIGPNALIDVSGGTKGGLAGGTVLLRAPLLRDGDVNVVLSSSATFRGARSVGLEAYATWSTADNGSATGADKHFDGVVDPAGWYDAYGNLLPGTFVDAGGNVVAAYDGSNLTASQISDLLINDFFTPTTANADHQTFYGYRNGDDSTGTPGTLMGFIEVPNFKPVANSAGIANFQMIPGVELDNPVSANVNNGDIKVVSNWNLGAEGKDGTPLFRYNYNDVLFAPHISFRAGRNITINASITDGFHETAPIASPTVPSQSFSYNGAVAEYNSQLSLYGIVNFDVGSIDLGGIVVDRSTLAVTQAANFGSLGISGPNVPNGYYNSYAGYIDAYALFYAYLFEF
jgi:hypothetical protein